MRAAHWLHHPNLTIKSTRYGCPLIKAVVYQTTHQRVSILALVAAFTLHPFTVACRLLVPTVITYRRFHIVSHAVARLQWIRRATMARQAADIKALNLAENGGVGRTPSAQMPLPASLTAGIANPAPLGLLCFGMTTGMPFVTAICGRIYMPSQLRSYICAVALCNCA